MKTTSTLLTAAALSAGLLIAASHANAALIDQGSTVYDNDLGISWLKNANLADTNHFGVADGINQNGEMSWNAAQSWIGAMNAASYLGYNDWRLPTTLQPDASCERQLTGGFSYGYNCTGSEMGHLFYNELGGVARSNIGATHNTNYDLFSNLQYDAFYWSGTEYPASNQAWYFSFFDGGVWDGSKDRIMYALAVRPGQVAAVPEPATTWLVGVGLLGLLGVARRRLALR